MPKADYVDRLIIFCIIALLGWTTIGLPILYSQGSQIASGLPECSYRIFGVCFVNAQSDGHIFGFGEFVQAFALLVLIYTISDVRSRFRVSTAPIPIWGISFWVSAAIGAATVISDFWFAKGYPIPWALSSQSYWQLALGALFLAMVLVWLWFAFVSPPKFGKRNAFNFTKALYTALLQGAEQDLPIIASELERSARSVVAFVNELPRHGERSEDRRTHKPTAANFANDVLLLIANRKFCRHIVASSPGTAIAFFRAMSEFRKYRIPIGQFASNMSTEALMNKDSILYHEDEGYYSGYFGYVRPFTNAMYGDFHLVEALTQGNSPLDIDLDVRFSMDAKQLEAYTRAVLATLKSALEHHEFHRHSYALNRAFSIIKSATADLYKLDYNPEGPTTPEKRDIHARLMAAVSFVDDAIDLLDTHGLEKTVLRRRDKNRWRRDYYEHLADMMFEIIGSGSAIKTKEFVNWTVQHNTIWSQFFGFTEKTATRKIVLFKLRRLLFDEVLSLETSPNYRSAAILGYLLNVMGIKEPKANFRSEEIPLQKAVIAWTRRNYLALVKRQHKVAAAAMLGTISFDEPNSRIVKTYFEGLGLVRPTDTLMLDQPP